MPKKGDSAYLSRIVVPIMIAIIIIISLKNCSFVNIINANINTSSNNMGKAVVNAILYASYNSITLIPIIVLLGKSIKSKKETIAVTIASTIIFLVLILAIYQLLVFSAINVSNIEIPVLTMLNDFHPAEKISYSIAIITAIIISGVSLIIIYIIAKKISKFIVQPVEETFEKQKQFISDASHELKTPIALIQGYAEGLIENVNTDDESRKFYAEVILDESNKMDVLVKQLLELMKLEYGKREFTDEKFDVVELINEVIRKCNVMLGENHIKVIFNEKEPIYAYADDFYIEQVMTNYFTNAIKHAKEVNGEKQIKITIQNVNDKIRVTVFNTGDKIPEEDLTRIWGRFYKVDDSRNRENSGSGIGLSIVRAIQNNYQNEYGVQNLSNGVEFYFDISTKK